MGDGDWECYNATGPPGEHYHEYEKQTCWNKNGLGMFSQTVPKSKSPQFTILENVLDNLDNGHGKIQCKAISHDLLGQCDFSANNRPEEKITFMTNLDGRLGQVQPWTF